MDVEEPALLVVAPEAYQHLIGRAARRLVGLAVGEDPQFSGRLLRAVPEGERNKGSWGVFERGNFFPSAYSPTIPHSAFKNHRAPDTQLGDE